MSLNCPHAWEEYKKLDLAHHALREEFLILRDEAKDFKNISREKVEQWRELHKKSKAFEGEWNSFLDEFFDVRRAKEIMGDQFYGPEEIKNAFGFEVSKDKIPKIPYSRAELEKAKGLGEKLILRINEDEKGNPMTVKRINELAQSRMALDEGKLLFKIDQYEEKDFFKNGSLKTEWKLVGGDFVEDSKGKNYFEQTKRLRAYLESVGSLTIEEAEECSDEKLEKLFMAFDGRGLAALKINQNHRRTPGEVLYDWFLHFKKFKDRGCLADGYECTNVVWLGGLILSIGFFNPLGGIVTGSRSDFVDDLGVVSVR